MSYVETSVQNSVPLGCMFLLKCEPFFKYSWYIVYILFFCLNFSHTSLVMVDVKVVKPVGCGKNMIAEVNVKWFLSQIYQLKGNIRMMLLHFIDYFVMLMSFNDYHPVFRWRNVVLYLLYWGTQLMTISSGLITQISYMMRTKYVHIWRLISNMRFLVGLVLFQFM